MRTGAALITALKALQLVASIALIGLCALLYSGPTLLPTLVFAGAYAAAAVLAALDYRPGIWLALPFGVLAALFSAYGVYRYVVSGFNFLTGTDGRVETVQVLPYLFLLVAAASIAAVLLHAGARGWFVHGRAARRID